VIQGPWAWYRGLGDGTGALGVVWGPRGWYGGLGGPQGGMGGFGSALVASGRNWHVRRPRAGARRVRWPQAATGGSGPRATRPTASGRDGKLRGTRDASGGLGPCREALVDARRVLRPQAAPGSRGPQAHVSSGLRPRPEALGRVR
jgi:hypothetical protein